MEEQKLALEELYLNHHERGSRYGYLYCHGERGPYLYRWVGMGKKVLDLGCRDGMLTQFFTSGNEVLGVDIDRKALKIAEEKRGIKTRWLDLNAEWPFKKESFDCIVACEIMEHIYFTKTFLQRIYDTLKPGGIFIGSVPNVFRFRNRLKFLLGKEFEIDPTHVQMFSYSKLESVLSGLFKEVKIIPIQGKILPFIKVSKKSPFALNRLFGRDLLWRCEKPGE